MAEMKITGQNFQKEVLQSGQPVLLDFWAPWCGPCRMLSPVVEQLAEEYEGKVKVGKVNVDEEGELASAFQVMSIPCIVVMKDGKIVEKAVGYRPKAQLEEMLR
ncbi:MAG: thioredoxin [Lachnospiraceae bacterium]|nr:thioredoxin [Lachnospiraceae bacterium]MDD7077811.1 thioredoxin [Lachnospiraceae bacterium]MDY3729016.1 thioredoxin [Candidatus Choladocola sp.]